VGFGPWGFKSLRPHSDTTAVGTRWATLAAAAALALVAAASAAGTQGGEMISKNWSGYIVDGGPFSVASATFNVPNLTTAPAATGTSEWVGVDGLDSSDRSLIQAGVAERLDPAKNLVHFHAWWEILPALETPVDLPVSAGDRITVSIARVGGGRWQIRIDNLTRHRGFATTQRYDGAGRTADWIVEAPSDKHFKVLTLGHYVPDVRFTGVHVAGTQGALHPVTMVQRGAVVSEVSQLTTHGFSVHYG
jgi:hypothetical protein